VLEVLIKAEINEVGTDSGFLIDWSAIDRRRGSWAYSQWKVAWNGVWEKNNRETRKKGDWWALYIAIHPSTSGVAAMGQFGTCFLPSISKNLFFSVHFRSAAILYVISTNIYRLRQQLLFSGGYISIFPSFRATNYFPLGRVFLPISHGILATPLPTPCIRCLPESLQWIHHDKTLTFTRPVLRYNTTNENTALQFEAIYAHDYYDQTGIMYYKTRIKIRILSEHAYKSERAKHILRCNMKIMNLRYMTELLTSKI